MRVLRQVALILLISGELSLEAVGGEAFADIVQDSTGFLAVLLADIRPGRGCRVYFDRDRVVVSWEAGCTAFARSNWTRADLPCCWRSIWARRESLGTRW
jgi:hypothetical protein